MKIKRDKGDDRRETRKGQGSKKLEKGKKKIKEQRQNLKKEAAEN